MSDITSNRILRTAGWSAYVCAVISFLGAIILSLFFMNIPIPGPGVTVGNSLLDFGLVSDYLGLVANAFMLPLPFALALLTHLQFTQSDLAYPRRPLVNGIVLTLGSFGALTLLIAQALLITGAMSFEVNLIYTMIGIGLLGAWLLLGNTLGRARGNLACWLSWLGSVSGAFFLCASAFIVISQPFGVIEEGTLALQPPVLMGTLIVLAILGGLAYLVTYPLWLVGLGHQLFAASSSHAKKAEQAQSIRTLP